MNRQRSAPKSTGDDNVWDEIARLLALQVRLQVENQTEAILALHKVGFSPPRITELLRLPQDTARATINQAKAKIPKKRSSKEGHEHGLDGIPS